MPWTITGKPMAFNTSGTLSMWFWSRGWLMKEGRRTVQSAISGRVQQAVQGNAQVPLHGSVRAQFDDVLQAAVAM
jgi:hypothetical protein